MIELSNVHIRVGDYRLQDLSFRVDSGKYAVIMGQTGIGKTTILEAICGLRPICSGKILIHGTNVARWSPADRNVGYTPQDLALFPTLNVREHLEFAMRLRRVARKEMASRVAELSELLGIGKLLQRRIRGLSGGEAQRIALGRALSFKPSLLLLDEPLSALDDQTRESMQSLLRNVNRHTGVTVLHVTHNQEDAHALADVCLQLTKEPTSGQVVISE